MGAEEQNIVKLVFSLRNVQFHKMSLKWWKMRSCVRETLHYFSQNEVRNSFYVLIVEAELSGFIRRSKQEEFDTSIFII